MKVSENMVLLMFLSISNLLGAERPVPIFADDAGSGYQPSFAGFSEEGSSGYESSGDEQSPQMPPANTIPTLSGDTSGTGHQVASVDGQDHQMSPNERAILYNLLDKMRPDPQDPEPLRRVGAIPDPRKLVVELCVFRKV